MLSISPDKVSVVIPTRGNVDMTEILESLEKAGFRDVIVWDNSKRENLGLYGRFAAIADAKHHVIATQSDDVVVTHWAEILEAYEPGVVTISYPQEWDIPWICCGTVFDKGMERAAFDLYFTQYEDDEDFRFFICDGIFALLALPRKVLAYPYKELAWANDADRVSTGGNWYDGRRTLIPERCNHLLGVA